MNRHIDMPCCFCSKQVHEVEHISTDDSGNIIIACPECYAKAVKFVKGGADTNVKS